MEFIRPPQQEMTARDNREMLATLNARAWAKFQVSYNRALFFDLPEKIASLERGLFMTGSIGGEHRKDLVEVLRGQKAAQVALAAGLAPPEDYADDGRPGLR